MKRFLGIGVLVAALTALPVGAANASYPPNVCALTKSITIEGARVMRDGKPAIRVTGTSNCLSGQVLIPYIRLSGQTSFFEGSARPVIASDGTFTFFRKGTKRVTVYFKTADVVSNRVSIASK